MAKNRIEYTLPLLLIPAKAKQQVKRFKNQLTNVVNTVAP